MRMREKTTQPIKDEGKIILNVKNSKEKHRETVVYFFLSCIFPKIQANPTHMHDVKHTINFERPNTFICHQSLLESQSSPSCTIAHWLELFTKSRPR